MRIHATHNLFYQVVETRYTRFISTRTCQLSVYGKDPRDYNRADIVKNLATGVTVVTYCTPIAGFQKTKTFENYEEGWRFMWRKLMGGRS